MFDQGSDKQGSFFTTIANVHTVASQHMLSIPIHFNLKFEPVKVSMYGIDFQPSFGLMIYCESVCAVYGVHDIGTMPDWEV